MTFATPGAAALSALGILIAAQYFLKLRRPVRMVPSTLIWMRSTVNRQANSPWQRLRAEPLLLLQLAVLAALVLAVMRPYVFRAGALGTNAVIVLDASLGSHATDGDQSRFEREVSAARAIVDAMPSDKTVSLIRLDGHPRVLLAESSDRSTLGAELKRQQAGYERPDVRAALSLAFSLTGQGEGNKAEVIMLRSASTALPSFNPAVEVRDQPFGSPRAANLGINSIGAALQPDGAVRVAYRVVNSGGTALKSDIDIMANGRIQAIDHVTVPPGGYALQSTAFIAVHVASVEARLTVQDSLPEDNTAWAVLPQTSRRKVVLVSPGNVFLSAVLAGLPGIATTLVSPSKYDQEVAQGARVVIFDGSVPHALPSTSLLLLNPRTDVLGLRLGGNRTVGAVTGADDPANLLKYVTPQNIHVLSARTVQTPDWAHSALRDRKGPLLVEGETSSAQGKNLRRVAALLFDLGKSDLPLGLDFPILMSNMIEWLAPVTSTDKTALHPGDSVTVFLPEGVTAAHITDPLGRVTALEPVGTSVSSGLVTYDSTDGPGIYTVTEQVASTRSAFVFAVSPEPAAENSLTTAIAPGSGVRPTVPPARTGEIPFELTAAFVLAAVALLAAEWLT